MSSNRWTKLCKLVSEDDGLPVREVGSWTEDKLYFWNKYLEITTTAMGDNKKWTGLVYVDMFAGPGVCRVKESNKRVPGSALLAAMAPKPFTEIHAVELDGKNADALRQRLSNLAPAAKSFVYQDDCNNAVNTIASSLPSGVLTLAFFDPAGLDFRFETVEVLCRDRRVDLLFLIADAYDIVRNIRIYEQAESEKLDALLGTSHWRDEWKGIENHDAVNIYDFFASFFEKQLTTRLGYKVTRRKRISGPNGPLYNLIFASKHKLGAKFWDEIAKRDRSGQRELF